jgi:hypothetical protein
MAEYLDMTHGQIVDALSQTRQFFEQEGPGARELIVEPLMARRVLLLGTAAAWV